MISMLIAHALAEERSIVFRIARYQAAYQTEDKWEWILCSSKEEIQKNMNQSRRLDLICLDLTIQDALEAAKMLRKAFPLAYMILVANDKISPVEYMIPQIKAESLLLKPLRKNKVAEVVSLAIQEYQKSISSPPEKKVFLLEAGGERTLLEYSRILYFESREKKIFLNDGVREYGFNETLDHLEETLTGDFVRCHRSFLVNAEKIEKVRISDNAVYLKGKVEIPLSRKYKPIIKDFLEGKRNEQG